MSQPRTKPICNVDEYLAIRPEALVTCGGGFMIRSLVLGAVIGCFLAGCRARSDQETLQGLWHLQAMRGAYDFHLSRLPNDETIIDFCGDNFTYQLSQGSNARCATGTYRCDPTKSPAEIAFTSANRTVVAIYSVAGSELRIRFAVDEAAPPKTFEGELEAGAALLVFRRDKAE